jgi:hypothetical protein
MRSACMGASGSSELAQACKTQVYECRLGNNDDDDDDDDDDDVVSFKVVAACSCSNLSSNLACLAALGLLEFAHGGYIILHCRIFVVS